MATHEEGFDERPLRAMHSSATMRDLAMTHDPHEMSSTATLGSAEELRVALQAQRNVCRTLDHENRHLLDRINLLERERVAEKARVVHISRMLAEERRATGGGVSHFNQDEAEEHVASALTGKTLPPDLSTSSSLTETINPLHQLHRTSPPPPPPAHPPSSSTPPPPPSSSFGKSCETPEWQGIRRKASTCGFVMNPTSLEFLNPIGKGTFGQTFLGVWHGAHVAIKTVRVTSRDEGALFAREVDLLSSIRHPNIVPFLGCVMNPPDQCWMVYEHMSKGSLSRWIHGGHVPPHGTHHHAPSSTALVSEESWVTRPRRTLVEKLKILLDIARGMQCLQDASPPILHRDLKPSNILLDSSNILLDSSCRARVADFGLSRRLESPADVLTGETGSYLYMAPEVIRHESYDSRADVYSFGVLANEVMSGELPYSGQYLTPVQVAMAVCRGTLRPRIPPQAHGMPNSVRQLMTQCWAHQVDERPSFRHVVAALLMALHEAEVAAKKAQESSGGASSLTNMLNKVLSMPSAALGWAAR